MKVLLVDDSKPMRSVRKKVLAALPGVEFAEAGGGIEAPIAAGRVVINGGPLLML